MDNRILPIIIAFNPDITLLQENISHLLEGTRSVLIWDNTPRSCFALQNLKPKDKIRIISNKENIGISKAINITAKIAEKEGYDYILTMDQDSILHNIKGYFKTSIKRQDDYPCIIGPMIKSKFTDNELCDKTVEVNDIITSGAIIPIKLFNKIGGFNELFFVDAIDIEFCIRARQHGYKIYINSSGILEQRFGNPDEHSIMGRKFTTYNYSPFRLYGIFRNHILIGRIHGFDKYIKSILYTYARTFIPKIILCESDKWQKLKAIIKGIYDGMTFHLFSKQKSEHNAF